MTTLNTRTTAQTLTAKSARKPLVLRLLDALVRADQGYRQRAHIARLSDDQLHDVAMTRAEAENGGR